MKLQHRSPAALPSPYLALLAFLWSLLFPVAIAIAIPNPQQRQQQTHLQFFFSEEAPAPTPGRAVLGATQPGGYSLAGHRLASYRVVKTPQGGLSTGLKRLVGAVWRGDYEGSASANPFCVQLCEDGARAFRSPICANMPRWEMLPNRARVTHAYVFDRRIVQRPDCAQVPGVGGVAAMPFQVYWVPKPAARA